ncbi:hypothetical protein [Streptomyces violascens]|uniref:hypothetical protein n=1 Tax=Streptomyces violascens TaxID=67381 RepID=UPI001678519A|nr:hypothetical protein [Streptomyces violascens]GGU51126.1 hypothetical protein GCM10010289_84430 [Streptomyces violascens]
MPKNQSTAAKKARAAAREGEKYTAALRREAERPFAPTTYSYVPVADAGDEHVWAHVVEDCRHCPCHAARVCADGVWGQASRPSHADGTPYTDPCPCEETAKVPEPRRLTITFKGITRTLDAEYYRHGVMRGHLRVLGYPFRGEPDDGSAPNRCGMFLFPSRVMRTARDDHGDTWLVRTRASVGGRPAAITGWWSDAAPEG